jgi:zinc transporter ZupT
MKHCFYLTFRPFFVVTGIVTALGALNAFWPQWTVEKVQLIPFNQDYTIILQHWGIMLGLMGGFMIVAAFWTDWRRPILIYGALEKTFLVYLVVSNLRRPYARGLWVGAVMDATVVLYTMVYFCVRGFKTPLLRPDGVLYEVRKSA